MPDFSFISDPARNFAAQNQMFKMADALRNAQMQQQQQQLFPYQLQQQQYAAEKAKALLPFANQMAQAEILQKTGEGTKNYALGKWYADIYNKAHPNNPISLDQAQQLVDTQQKALGAGQATSQEAQPANINTQGQGQANVPTQAAAPAALQANAPNQATQAPITQSLQQQGRGMFGYNYPEMTPQEMGQMGIMHIRPESYYQQTANVGKQIALDMQDYHDAINSASNVVNQMQPYENLVNRAEDLSNQLSSIYKIPMQSAQTMEGFLGAVKKLNDPRAYAIASELDQIYSELQPANIKTVVGALGGVIRNVPEIKLANDLKVLKSDPMSTRALKLKRFLTTAEYAKQSRDMQSYFRGDPLSGRAGIPYAYSQKLFTNFQNDFPLIDKNGNFDPNASKYWPLYTSREAIGAAANGKDYHPSKDAIKYFEKTNHISKALKEKYPLNIQNIPVSQGGTLQPTRQGAGLPSLSEIDAELNRRKMK